MINVLIADHQAIFRAGVATVLAAEDDLRIVGQPQSSKQMLNALEHFRVRVLLISASFLRPFSAVHALAVRQTTSMLVVVETEDEASGFMAMGAQGVVYRSVSGPTIIYAVRRLAHGKTFIHTPNSGITQIGEDQVGTRVRDRLSEKELRIVAAVVQGFKNREIAMQLFSTEQAIKSALHAIFDKIGVSDRLELALYVLHHRILARATVAA